MSHSFQILFLKNMIDTQQPRKTIRLSGSVAKIYDCQISTYLLTTTPPPPRSFLHDFVTFNPSLSEFQVAMALGVVLRLGNPRFEASTGHSAE